LTTDLLNVQPVQERGDLIAKKPLNPNQEPVALNSLLDAADSPFNDNENLTLNRDRFIKESNQIKNVSLSGKFVFALKLVTVGEFKK